MKMIKLMLPGMVLLLLMGCTLAKVDVNVVSERTTLENQVLGSYNSLNNDVLLVASVRGVDPSGNIIKPPKRSNEHMESVAAMQVIAFHADDLTSFKRLGWTGENNKGLIAPFEIKKTDVPPDLLEFAERFEPDEFNSIIDEVNRAREIVMKRVVEINENFTLKDLLNIQRVFGKLNRENALPGEKVQDENGIWEVK